MIADLYRLGKKMSNYIYSPKFPKPKDEGWFLTLGCVEDRELLALKRIGYRSNKSSHQLCFTAPKKLGIKRLKFMIYQKVLLKHINFDRSYNLLIVPYV